MGKGAQFILRNYALRHGAPWELLSDRGRVFLSDVMLAECNIIYCKASTCHPQMNGLAKWFNRTFDTLMRMHASSDYKNNRDILLPFVIFSYKTAAQATTGFLPFFLSYGC